MTLPSALDFVMEDDTTLEEEEEETPVKSDALLTTSLLPRETRSFKSCPRDNGEEDEDEFR